MAINDNQKLDFLWKKLGYGVSKTDINSIKNATNESIPSPLLIRGDRLWAEADQIPTTIPSSDTSQVQLETIETTADATASANRTWKTGNGDWIPPEFGSTYQIKVYLDNSGAANPASTGTQLFAAGSGNNDEWFFDYQSGVLNFIGDNLPSGISGKTVYIIGARYIGNFGISGTTDGIVEGATNLYYTDERVDDRVANLILDGQGITKSYDDAGNLLNIAIDFTEFDSDDIIEGAVNTFLASRTTDDIPEGSTNLYYTDARVDTNFATKTTTDLTEGTNLYYTDARVDTNFATKTTTDLTEGTNLYYTDARVQTYLTANNYATISTVTQQVAAQIGAIQSDLDDEIYDREQADLNLQSQIDNLVLNDLTDVSVTSPTSGDALVWNGTSWIPQAPFSQADFDSAFAAKTTTDLTEGTNLYYTQTRFDSAFTAKSTTDLSEGTNLYYTDERVDDRVAALIQDGVGITKTYDDAGNLLNIAIDFTEFDSDDIIEGAVNTFLASRTTDDIPEGSTNLYYTEARFDTRLATKSTTDLAEGTNLYFTEERVDDRVAALIQAGEDISVVYDDVANTLTIALASSVDGLDLSNNSTDDLSEGSTNLYYTDARVDANFATKTTTDLTEGTNLYYTDARFDVRLATKTTTDLTEGTNLYYTEARVDANIATKTTDDITEGATNLYYTDARVQTYLTANNYATISTVTQQVAAQIGSLQSDLDDEIYDREQGDLALQNQIDSLTTTDVAEGTNLYYTDARFDARLAAKTTTDLTEGTNLYYTDARVQTKLGDVSGHIIPDTDVTYDLGSTTNKFRDLYLSGSSIYLGSLQLSDNNGALEVTASGSTEVFATETYVDTAISNLIDTAPTTLDTLNELAAALGDDPNFSTTITNLIGTKLATADFNTTADTWLGTKSTTDLSEGTNLYYTDARVDARITASNPYDSSDFDTDFSGKSTTDLTEGTNLYYTDARADARVAAANIGVLNDVNTTGIATGDFLLYDGSEFLPVDFATEVTTYADSRINLASIQDLSDVDAVDTPANGDVLLYDAGNSNFGFINLGNEINSYFDIRFATKDTDNLTEGTTNLYYTDARVASYLSGTGYATTSYVTAQIASISSDLDDEVYDREQADLNLQSQIDSLTTNIGALVLDDLSDVDTTTTAPTNGQTLIFNGTTFVPGTISGYTSTDFDTDFATKSTTDLSEGTNLYYTDARVRTHIQGADLDMGSNKILFSNVYANTGDLPNASSYHGMFAHVHGTGKAYYAHNGQWVELANQSELPTSTDDVSEGSTNLYYTDARFDARLATKSTTDISEGTNLYYTDARVDARITASNPYDSSDFDTDFGTKSTTDLSEGTNLYYTDARVQSYLTAQGIAAETLTSLGIAGNVLTYTDEDGNTTNIDLSLYLDDTNLARLVSGTLNGTTGIATFTRDDATTFTIDFSPLFDDTNLSRINSATFTNGTLTLTRDDASTAATVSLDGRYLQDLSGLTTDNLSEGSTNLYYTQTRFNSAFAAKTTTDLTEGTNLYYTDARFDTRLATKTTTDLTEGTNLYYTDARVDARIAAANIVSGSSIDALSDVDTTTVAPTDGQALVWDNTNSKWVPGASAGSSIDVSDIAPSSPSDGDLWFDSSELKTYIYYNDGTSSQWVEAAGNVASNVHLSDAAPSTPSEGDLWFNSSNLRLYVYYNDGSSSQWIEASGSVNSAGQTSLDDLTDVDTTTTAPTNGQTLVFNGTNFVPGTISGYATSDFNTDFATKDTDDLTEGSTNLYYTDSRVQTKLGDVSGHIIPDTDVTYDLGSSTHKFRDLYLSGNSIILGGITLTESSGSLLVTPTAGGANNTFATESYVDTAISNLIDTAPTTLDTLNELAAALGDDPNFATTITNLIGTKLATADFNTTADSWLTTKSTTNLSEGTNLYYTDARADARVNLQTGTNLDLSSKTTTDLAEGINLYYTQTRFDSAFTAKSTTDLSEGTNLYYTDARVRAHVEGQDLDLGTNKVLFSNMYATTGDLPSATSYHGMFAHVHGTGKAYYAHSGSWIELANDSQIVAQDFSWSSITGTPTTLAGYGITDGYVDADVDTHLNTSTATSNQVLSWDGTDYAWVAQSGGGGGGASVSVSDTAPTSPSEGDLWFNSSNTKMYVYFNDGTSSQWIQSNPSGATSPITASDTAPTNPVENSMWFDSTDGTLYFRYNDGTSEQWVNLIGATSNGGGGGGGSSVTVSDTAPTTPTEGDMWFDSRYAVLLVYYGTQWVNVSGESGSSTTPSWQETTNHTASVGDKLFVDCSGGAVTVTLPVSPSMGDEIRIIDATGNASTNNITIARNGSNIQGVADNLIIDTDRAAFGLVYYNSTQGWLLMER